MMAVMAGCRITSVSPDTTADIVLKPGQTQVFTAEGIDFILGAVPFFDEVGFVWRVNKKDQLNWPPDVHDRGVIRSTFAYTPTLDDAGVKSIEAGLGIWHTPMDGPQFRYHDETDSRFWTVEVWGITRTPLQSHLELQQGATQSLAVSPCPALGDYAYHWFLDGVQIPDISSASFDYRPGPGDAGSHRVEV